MLQFAAYGQFVLVEYNEESNCTKYCHTFTHIVKQLDIRFIW